MAEQKIPTLTGGTFFMLLLESAKQGRREKETWGNKSPFTEHDVFVELIKVAVPTYTKPSDAKHLASTVSAYKCCTTKSGKLPITEQANISTFDTRIKSEYQALLAQMSSLVDAYIDFEGKREWLAKALIELVCESGCVAEDSKLFVLKDGASVKMSILRSSSDICLPSLLIGIWHYIIVNKIKNVTGKATADAWCKPTRNNTREPFDSNIGDAITRKLNVFMSEFTEHDDDSDTNCNATFDNHDDGEPFVSYDEPFRQTGHEEIPHQTLQIVNAPNSIFNIGDNVTINKSEISGNVTINLGR